MCIGGHDHNCSSQAQYVCTLVEVLGAGAVDNPLEITGCDVQQGLDRLF